MIDDEGKPLAQTALLMEHARWVMEWHTRRAEGAATRAVVVLGFAGVVLALLIHGAVSAGLDLDPTAWTWTFAVVTVAALLTSSFAAVRAITTEEVRMHDVLSEDPSGEAAVSAAEHEATQRAYWLERAVWALGLALLALAALGLNLLNLS